jgi:hypothetical protein
MTIQADEPDDTQDDVLDLTDDQQLPPEDDDQDDSQDDDQPDDEEEVVVSIGDEAAPASDEAPEWVRELRKQNRELQRELAEARKGKSPEIPEVGDKPTLEACEFDEERYEQELNGWLDRKAKADRAKSEAEQSQAKAQEAWSADLAAFRDQSKTLGAKDFASAEEEVTAVLSPVQQAILIQGAESKALVVYALGKNPAKLRELAKITDPVKFAFAAAKLETQTKMEKRRPTSSPEKQVRGSAPLSGGSDATLERLEKEADRTGDRTKLIAYKQKLRTRAKA